VGELRPVKQAKARKRISDLKVRERLADGTEEK